MRAAGEALKHTIESCQECYQGKRCEDCGEQDQCQERVALAALQEHFPGLVPAEGKT